MKPSVVVSIAVTCVASAVPAAAQVAANRYLDDPTRGIELPVTPLAGDADARATVANPGALQFLDGQSLVLAATGLTDQAASGGGGLGGYAATPLGGGLIPRFAVAAGLERLFPPRASLDPDPGEPWRLSLAASVSAWRGWALGGTWHHGFGGGAAAGTSTFDVGVANRFGNHLAVGAVVRGINAPMVAGFAVPRRYLLELGVRPLGTSSLELGLGAEVTEPTAQRGAAGGGWLRASVGVVTGVAVEAVAEARPVIARVTTGTGDVRDQAGRDVRVTAGVSISFGQLGLAAYGGGRLADGTADGAGASLVARWAELPAPSVVPTAPRIERIELSGPQSARAVVAAALRLRAIARDPHVRGVVLAIDSVGAGWASLEELRAEVARVRASGKQVFAYLVSATSRDYWLASSADRIYLDPGGGVRLVGFAGTTLYLKGLFDQLGVEAQFEKIREYKSAPEQFTETGPTPAAARMRDELYDGMWDAFVEGIAAGRHLDPATVRALVDGGPYTAGQLADDHRLVDAVATPERVVELIAHELGGLAPVAVAPRVKDDRWERPGVAVIYADGDIVDGRSQNIPLIGRRLVGGETVAALIAAARQSPRVAAIVIRIDSPGGSALASELMSREVFATRGRKPIVCSMGDVAASGGYFLAAGCDTVLASSTTITGSIGIFYGKFDLSGLLGRLGINAETFRRGARADMDSMFRPYTEDERAALLDRLGYFYGRFTDAVARGRGLTQARVDQLGRGHVYTGAQALALGLVDQLGGVADAVALAKTRAGLAADAPVRLIELPRSQPGLLGALGRLVGGAQADATDAGSLWALPAVRAALAAVPPALLVTPGGAQARLPFDVVWE
ncbi:MAG: signal peptide peptidase SppA [Kofleriaceae bacterium]